MLSLAPLQGAFPRVPIPRPEGLGYSIRPLRGHHAGLKPFQNVQTPEESRVRFPGRCEANQSVSPYLCVFGARLSSLFSQRLRRKGVSSEI
jgi:hypothetical protein